MDVQGAHGGHDEEVRQNEGPATSPGSPEPAAQIGDVDPHLDGKRSWQRLTRGDAVAEFIFRQPLSFCDQLFFHLPAEGDRAAKTERPEAEVIAHQVPDPHAENAFVPLHTAPSLSTTTSRHNSRSSDYQSRSRCQPSSTAQPCPRP